LLFGVGGSAIALGSVEPAAELGMRAGRGLSIEQLADAGGGTEIFRTVVSFTGFLVLVVFVGAIATEFSRGTMRTMLLRQPHRLRLLAGKLAALLTFAAVVLMATELVSWGASLALAPGEGVDTSAWMTLDALGAATTDFGAVLLWVFGYALLGTAIAVVLRSVPVALAVAIAWFGPFEHILQDGWTTANRAFPGLLLEVFAAGGTTEVSATRALLTVAVYVAVAAVVASWVFARRDVTA
jgi:ABC-type transport system involved in multi-copper enzyme maturation permease subunit